MNNSKHILRNKSGFSKSGYIVKNTTILLLVAHYADASMMGTSNDTRVTFQKFRKNLRKCRDELVKKVWKQGRDGVCSRTTMSNIYKPHPHTYPYMWYILVLNFAESV